jgi:hypothetical protein
MRLATLLILLLFAWHFANTALEARRRRQVRARQAKRREVNKQRMRRMWVVDDPDTGMTIKGREFHFYDWDGEE